MAAGTGRQILEVLPPFAAAGRGIPAPQVVAGHRHAGPADTTTDPGSPAIDVRPTSLHPQPPKPTTGQIDDATQLTPLSVLA
jgi:hypothetical protein